LDPTSFPRSSEIDSQLRVPDAGKSETRGGCRATFRSRRRTGFVVRAVRKQSADCPRGPERL